MLSMAGLSALGFASAAACVGFLLWNWHPAKVFMGDTGSLFLGALCAAWPLPGYALILVLVGIIYIVETMSDIIQVLYFKATHGKRIFRMAPLHHHLEWGAGRKQRWYLSSPASRWCSASWPFSGDRALPCPVSPRADPGGILSCQEPF